MRLRQTGLIFNDFLQGGNGFSRLIPSQFQTSSEVEARDLAAAGLEDLVNDRCSLIQFVLAQIEFRQLLFWLQHFGINRRSFFIRGSSFIGPLVGSVEVPQGERGSDVTGGD